MTGPEGGFYSAQDADSEGEEGKYYLFSPAEIKGVLGEQDGEAFNEYFDITAEGNFEGKNIPNLLKHENISVPFRFREERQRLYEYRKKRFALHLDDKVLTSWNGLAIGAFSGLYRITGKREYLEAAVKAERFIDRKLTDGTALYVSFREGRHSGHGFLDDYAYVIFGLLSLYEAALDPHYLERACVLCDKAAENFYENKQGGFFLYGEENEQLILRPKETYDGAMPSGNSMMAYNLVRLYLITGEERFQTLARRQCRFMCEECADAPTGAAMFLQALSDFTMEPEKITVVADGELPEDLSQKIPLGTAVCILKHPTAEYPLKDDKLTFYICRDQCCRPPVDELKPAVQGQDKDGNCFTRA